jgi:DMSO/TMAO reductase YedYZ heme-binding membrane subunit
VTNHLWWYTARASGIVGWALLAAGVLWGLALSTKVLRGRPKPNWMLDLHRFLGGLAVVFTGVHVGGLVFDDYLHFGPSEILVPFTSAYRPAAVAWGVVALYFVVAVEVTSLLRRRLSKRQWRAVHFLSFPLFLAATIHGLTAGTDATSPILRVSMIAVSLAVAGLTAVRITGATTPPTRLRPPTTTARPAARSAVEA